VSLGHVFTISMHFANSPQLWFPVDLIIPAQFFMLCLAVEVLDTFAVHSKFSCKNRITTAITILTGHTSATSLASRQMPHTI